MTVFFRHSKHLLASLALFSVLGLMLAMRPTPSAMERVIARGELVVLTRPSNTTYYEDQHGFTGMEYELAKGFADSLGVELRILESDDLSYIRYAIRKGTADIAAAGLVAIRAGAPLVGLSPGQDVREGPERHCARDIIKIHNQRLSLHRVIGPESNNNDMCE